MTRKGSQVRVLYGPPGIICSDRVFPTPSKESFTSRCDAEWRIEEVAKVGAFDLSVVQMGNAAYNAVVSKTPTSAKLLRRVPRRERAKVRGTAADLGVAPFPSLTLGARRKIGQRGIESEIRRLLRGGRRPGLSRRRASPCRYFGNPPATPGSADAFEEEVWPKSE